MINQTGLPALRCGDRKSRVSLLLALGGAVLLAGCSSSVPVENLANDEDAAALAADNASDAAAALAEMENEVVPALESSLLPPEPGEPGGLPIDRTALNEGDKDQAGPYGAGQLVEKYAGLLEQGRYKEAYALWAEAGRASGMDEAAFVASFDQYSERHVRIGRPQLGKDGAATIATVPVQIYGRIAETGKTFNLYGPLTLVRTDADPQSTSSAPTWRIRKAQLDAVGIVKEVPTAAPAPVPAS